MQRGTEKKKNDRETEGDVLKQTETDRHTDNVSSLPFGFLPKFLLHGEHIYF